MKISKIFIYTYFFLIANPVFSQTSPIVHEGEIVFERRVNTYAILDKYYVNDNETGGEQFAQQYKANNPQFKAANFILQFNDSISYYFPDFEKESTPFLSSAAGSNTVYFDLKTGIFTAKKNVFGDILVVNDTIRKIQWKITDEMKDIAGFSCRRANAIIMDSIYVVAFYADNIVPKAGPESFNGLPGMILGVVLPHEHVTWFATRFSPKHISNYQIKMPGNEKKMSNADLLNTLINNPIIKGDFRRKQLYFHRILL